MPRIIRRERALDDLAEHWSYRVLERDETSADTLIDRIEKRLSLLAEHPESGTKREELRPGLRFIALGKLNLYYNPLRDGIELVRVLDGRRDIHALFAEDEDEE